MGNTLIILLYRYSDIVHGSTYLFVIFIRDVWIYKIKPNAWIVFLVGFLTPVWRNCICWDTSCSKRHLIFDTLNVAPRFTRMDWPSWRHEWRGEVPEPIRVDFLVCQTRSKKHRNLGRLKPPKRTAGTPKKGLFVKVSLISSSCLFQPSAFSGSISVLLAGVPTVATHAFVFCRNVPPLMGQK